MKEDILKNRIESSGLMTIDLERFYPQRNMLTFDIKDYLFQGLILKEKDFREALKNHDWTQYKDSVICIFCSTDAIIPVWAYMLVSSNVVPFASEIFTGTKDEYLKLYYKNFINSLVIENYKDQRVVIKGCSDKPVPASAYADIQVKLQPYAQSIMYGEPCSTVPVFKRPRKLESK
jgi:hypothetical protein